MWCILGASVDIGTDLAPAPLPPASVPIWRAFVAGGFGGVVSRTATAPLEKVKILQQVYTHICTYYSANDNGQSSYIFQH